MKAWLGILVVAALVATGAYIWVKRANTEPRAALRTVEIRRGEIVSTIGATGTVEPEEVVDVGAQVAGMILSLGADADGRPIDYGSRVTAGMVLAKIDDALYASDLESAKANLESTRADVRLSEAARDQAVAKLDQARRDWDRAQQLGASESLAKRSYDAYQAGFEVAKADLASAEAAIAQAGARVLVAQAVLDRATRNLGYCTIRSPVDGTIIDRRVNIGQTVVSSLNAPSLFLIARDLTRVQVWAAVNEADISRIHPGQEATFLVDAYPGRVFEGTVGKIRLNASMTQNVVTYTVEIVADNADGALLPYLTANVSFISARVEDVLCVPNAALRWTPTPERIDPAAAPAAPPPASGGTVWVEAGEFVRPLPVTLGIGNGKLTEVSGIDVNEGLRVVVGEQRGADARTGQGTNPFVPQINRQRTQSATGGQSAAPGR
ncbi:MAG: efflux RND transporter periplasmic adaptor subunit [Phycisphaerales bacterium]